MNTSIFKIKLFLISIIVSTSAYSQVVFDDSRSFNKKGTNNILNAKNPEEIGVRTSTQIQEDKDAPLDYAFVDDNDILWSTMVWEIIDLNQKVNFPLLYPTDLEVVGDERRPMLWWLRQGIENGSIPIYDANSPYGNLTEKITKDEDIANIFSEYRYKNESNIEFLDEPTMTVNDTLQKQIGDLNFNPYTISSEDPRRLEFESDTTNIILFPYEIESTSSARKAGINVLTYNDFLDYDENQLDYSIRERSGYDEAITELIENKLFIEGTHYEYKQVEYDEIVQYLVKGMWYFDKKYSELIYRPIAISPVRKAENLVEEIEEFTFDPIADLRGEDQADSDGDGVGDDNEFDYDTNPNLDDTDGDGVKDNIEILLIDVVGDDELATNSENSPTQQQIEEYFEELNNEQEVEDEQVPELENKFPMFWVFYPHAREILQKGQAFNNRNLSQSISFDDIINSRRFHSVIYKEENVYENREVKDYIRNNSFMRLLESERIKEKIRNFEHDMWSW